MFFDRDKVQMAVETEHDAYLPGETIRGTFRAVILKEVTITALRLHFYAKEKAEVAASSANGGGKQKGEDENVHFEKLFTFFGYSKESGRKGGATLAPTPEGEEGLVYPFEIQLPPTTAPSFSFQLKKDGEVSLTYKLRAMCIIDKGFDGKVDKIIKVLTATPQYQFLSLRNQMHSMKPQTVALPRQSSCICLSKDPDPSITVSLSCPQLIIFDENDAMKKGVADQECVPIDVNQPLPDTPAAASAGANAGKGRSGASAKRHATYLPVTVSIVNNSRKKTIKSVVVTLKQFMQIECKGVSRAEVRPVASKMHIPPTGGIGPRQAYQTTINLHLGLYLSMYGTRDERRSFLTGGVLMPTMATKLIEVSNIVEVSFPKMRTKEEAVSMPDACWFTSAVDTGNVVPPTPVRYNTSVTPPEEIVGGAML